MIHLVFFLIFDRGYFTFFYGQTKHNRVGGRKEQTNKRTLGSAPSARKGEVCDTFLFILWTNASVYSSENSHKATTNADLSSCVGQTVLCRSTGLSSRLSDSCSSPDCLLLLSFVDWSLLISSAVLPSSAFSRTFLSLSTSGLAHRPFCGFCAKIDKGIVWLAPTHTNTMNAQYRVTYCRPHGFFWFSVLSSVLQP